MARENYQFFWQINHFKVVKITENEIPDFIENSFQVVAKVSDF